MSEQKSKIIKPYSNNEKQVKNYGLGDEVKVEINSLSIIPIIADKIYKNPMSSIRELYNNEVTACEKALLIDPTLDQKIRIELDTDTRELTIQGFNSLGMDSSTFMNILRVMGMSGNDQGDQKGFFGIGFYSFFKISERIIIISNSLETKENFAYICKSALKFERLQDNNFKKLDKSGFKIVLTVKDKIELDEIEYYVKKIVKISGIKTELIIDGSEIELTQYEDLEDYFKKYYHEFFNDPLTADYSIYYEVRKNEDFDLIIGKLEHSKQIEQGNLKESFLLNTPIDLDLNRDYDEICLINIKNERKFKPTPDRERFDQESENKLRDECNNYDLSNFDIDKFTRPKTLNEWYDNYLRWFFEYIGEDKHIIYINTEIKSLRHTDRWSGNHKFSSMSYHLPKEKPKKLIYSLSFRKKKFEEIEENDQNAFCITPKKKNETQLENLELIGFELLQTKKRKYSNSGRSRNRKQLSNNFKCHFHQYCKDLDHLNGDEIIIRTDGDLHEDKRLLNDIDYNFQEDFCFVPITANCKALEWKTLIDPYLDYTFITSYGLFTLRQILKVIERRKWWVEYTNNEARLDKLLKRKDNFVINIDENSKLFELIRLYVNKKYSFRLSHTNIDTNYKEDIERILTNEDLKSIFNEFSYNHCFDYQDFLRWMKLQEKLKE